MYHDFSSATFAPLSSAKELLLRPIEASWLNNSTPAMALHRRTTNEVIINGPSRVLVSATIQSISRHSRPTFSQAGTQRTRYIAIYKPFDHKITPQPIPNHPLFTMQPPYESNRPSVVGHRQAFAFGASTVRRGVCRTVLF